MSIWKRLDEKLYSLELGEMFPGLLGSMWSVPFAVGTLQAYSTGDYFSAAVGAIGTICSILLMYGTLEPYFERRKIYKILKASEKKY